MYKRTISIQKILDKINTLIKDINAMRPFSEDLNLVLQSKLRVDWTFNSNAIEGNTLTYGETLYFLNFGLTSEGKPLKDYLEARNHAQAIDEIFQIVTGKRPVTESMIKGLHSILLKGIEFTPAKNLQGQIVQKPLHPGKYKLQPNHVLTISGKIHKYAEPIHVPLVMEQLMEWLKSDKKLDIIEKAILFHYKFVAIHPFDDGNGRMARIIMNIILMKDRLLPCIISSLNRKLYLQALEKSDMEKQPAYFVEFVLREYLRNLENFLDILMNKDTISNPDSDTLNFDQRKEYILNLLKEDVWAIGQIHKKLPFIKHPTLKSDLNKLLEQKLIQSNGEGKGRIYFRLKESSKKKEHTLDDVLNIRSPLKD